MMTDKEFFQKYLCALYRMKIKNISINVAMYGCNLVQGNPLAFILEENYLSFTAMYQAFSDKYRISAKILFSGMHQSTIGNSPSRYDWSDTGFSYKDIERFGFFVYYLKSDWYVPYDYLVSIPSLKNCDSLLGKVLDIYKN